MSNRRQQLEPEFLSRPGATQILSSSRALSAESAHHTRTTAREHPAEQPRPPFQVDIRTLCTVRPISTHLSCFPAGRCVFPPNTYRLLQTTCLFVRNSIRSNCGTDPLSLVPRCSQKTERQGHATPADCSAAAASSQYTVCLARGNWLIQVKEQQDSEDRGDQQVVEFGYHGLMTPWLRLTPCLPATCIRVLTFHVGNTGVNERDGPGFVTISFQLRRCGPSVEARTNQKAPHFRHQKRHSLSCVLPLYQAMLCVHATHGPTTPPRLHPTYSHVGILRSTPARASYLGHAAHSRSLPSSQVSKMALAASFGRPGEFPDRWNAPSSEFLQHALCGTDASECFRCGLVPGTSTIGRNAYCSLMPAARLKQQASARPQHYGGMLSSHAVLTVDQVM